MKTECMKFDDLSKELIRLKRRDGTWFEQAIWHFSGAVQDFGLIVLAGQKIFVEVDVSGDQLHNFRQVANPENPCKTITADFKQIEDGGMMLSLTQPFNKDVKFDMEILQIDGARLAATSSLPVKVGMKSHEMWPDPISMVVLKNARLIDTDSINVSDSSNPKTGNILIEKVESTGKLSWIWWAAMALLLTNFIVKLLVNK